MTALANLTPNRATDVIDRPRPQFKYLAGGTLQLASFLDSTQEVPSSATITVLRSGGAPCTTPVTNAVVSIDANGTMTYALTGANCDMLPGYGESYAPWTAQWKYTVSGVVYQKSTAFDVVQYPLYNVVRGTDLQSHVIDLGDTSFTSESGATAFQSYISMSFADIMQRLENQGNRPWLVLDSEQIRRPVEYLALAKYFDGRWKEKGDRWWERKEEFYKKFEAWFTSTKFIYNINQTGYAIPAEVNRPINDPYFRI